MMIKSINKKILFTILGIKGLVLGLILFTGSGPGTVIAQTEVPEGEGYEVLEKEDSGAALPGDDGDPLGLFDEEVRSSKEMALLEAIARREAEIKKVEERLATDRDHLDTVMTDIALQLDELKAVRKEINSAYSKVKAFNTQKIARLVKIYSSMPSEEAAQRIEKIELYTAVMILTSMREKTAGKILGQVEVKRAVEISQLMKKEIR